jgi:eukaryotic-like serine/threonine-protein kinase
MNRFIQELQDRGVIRVAGLYGAIVWLLLQASDVLFPAFDIPDSSVKILLYGSIACFPVVVLLAWFYEITDKGIQLEEDVRRTGAKRLGTGNEIYFIFIAILGIALSISVWINIQSNVEVDAEPQEFISVLIADFDNQTGDPLFDGSVEEALSIGIEGASFITAYNRTTALSIANQLNSGEELNDERARLVAVREGIDLILSGTIEFDEDEYLLSLNAIDPKGGGIVAEADASATGKLEVLQAVGSLASQLRSELGDASIVQDDESLNSETFSASSLKAMQLYAEAQSKAQNGEHEAAISLYEQAAQEDNNFGRAYSGWALSEFQLGRRKKATELWEKTLTLLQGMTDREKYRTLGIYYTRSSRNYAKATENYEQLVEQFPSDAVGRSNLAVSYFMNREFPKALEAGGAVAKLYPNETTVLSNHALYAMYAGEFETARSIADNLVKSDNVYFKAYLPLAIAQLSAGDINSAKKSYSAMSQLGTRGSSLSKTGLADIALSSGDAEVAISTLHTGILEDEEAGNTYYQASKQILLAEAQTALGLRKEALSSIDAALSSSTSIAIRVSAAMLFIQLNESEKALEIANLLGQRLQSEERAYGQLIEGSIALHEGSFIEAVDTILGSINKADSWLARFQLGKAYFKAEAYVEALSEFETCQTRIGESTALYLDDIPTFRRSIELSYWLGNVQQELGITNNAIKNLQSYLDHKKSGPLTNDARTRLQRLNSN